MKTKIQKQKDAKLFKFLKELRSELKDPKKFSLCKFCISKKQTDVSAVSRALQKTKTIKKTGLSKATKWQWIAGEPTSKMVDIIFKEKRTSKEKYISKDSTKRNQEQLILKYFDILKKLKIILDNTSHLSMKSFVSKNKCQHLSVVLQEGKIIKKISGVSYGEWEWISIEPNRDMAIRTLQKLTSIRDLKTEKIQKIKEAEKAKQIKLVEPIVLDTIKPKKEKTTQPAKKTVEPNKKVETKTLDYYEVKFFFGLITIKIKSIFK